jgi:hypothetical protein
MWTRLLKPAVVMLLFPACAWPQAAQLTTAAQVLDRYKQALGGQQAIANVRSMTVRGEVESNATPGKATFVYYAKPFKSLFKLTRVDGARITAGFDGKVSWTITSKGAEIDTGTSVDAIRRDADLQYPLHQPDYFKQLELAGISDFEGHRCYWLHGTTTWGKDNNQFYDVETGLVPNVDAGRSLLVSARQLQAHVRRHPAASTHSAQGVRPHARERSAWRESEDRVQPHLHGGPTRRLRGSCP